MTTRELDAAIAEALGLPPVEELRPARPGRGWAALYGWRVNPLGVDDDLVEEFIYSRDGGDVALSPMRFASGFRPPAYSTDPVAADALMRALRERGMGAVIVVEGDTPAGVTVFKPGVEGPRHSASAGTWTEALARAALAALTAQP